MLRRLQYNTRTRNIHTEVRARVNDDDDDDDEKQQRMQQQRASKSAVTSIACAAQSNL